MAGGPVSLANAGIPNAPAGGERGVDPDAPWDACVLTFFSRGVRSSPTCRRYVAHHPLPNEKFPSALLQKRHEFIHSEQELADVVVQHRLPQRVTGMRFAE